jgi:WD40 repeat protein/beta-lactamase regulating signal transducer with metallopeptidase domain
MSFISEIEPPTAGLSESSISAEPPSVPAAGDLVRSQERTIPVPTTGSPADPARPIPQHPSRSYRVSWTVLGFFVWFIGLVTISTVGVLRYASFARRLRGASLARDDWQGEWQSILDQAAIRRSIPLVLTDDEGPALCWLPNGYQLIVPERLWNVLGTNQRSVILRHELAHLHRGDLWTTLLARGLSVIHWFNPFAWWACGRFEAEAEFVCDQGSTSGDRIVLAELLVHLGSGERRQLAAVRSAGAGGLFERIERLLNEPPPATRWKQAIPVVLAVIALGTFALRLRAVEESLQSDRSDSDGNGTTNAAAEPRSKSPRALAQIGSDHLQTGMSFISEIAFSPDGKLIAASTVNESSPRITLFRVADGRQVKRLIPPDKPRGWVYCVAISSDGQSLVWGEVRGYVALWDLRNDRILFREQLHSTEVNNVAFSPDGKTFASAGGDGAVRLRRVDRPAEILRDIATGERHPASRGFTSIPRVVPVGPLCLTFTRDGSRVVVGSGSSNTISVWRVADGQLVKSIDNVSGKSTGEIGMPLLNAVAVTPDGRRILSAGQRTVPVTETKLKVNMRNVTLSAVRIWDLDTGRLIRDYSGPEDFGFGYAALSPDGKRVAISDLHSLTILDAETGRAEQTIADPGRHGKIPVFSPDGSLVALPIMSAIGIFDVRTGRRLRHDDGTPTGEFRSAAWTPSGKELVTSHGDGGIRLWDTGSGRLAWYKDWATVLGEAGEADIPFHVSVSQDGRRIAAAGVRDNPLDGHGGAVTVLDAKDGRLIRRVLLQRVRGGALSPDRKTFVATTEFGTRFVGVDVETGQEIYAFPRAIERIQLDAGTGFHFLPDSTSFFGAFRDGNVIRFDARNGTEQARFLADWRTPEQRQAGKPRAPHIFAGDFSADSRILVSSDPGFVRIWDTATGKLKRSISVSQNAVCFLGVASDGKTVATAEVHRAGRPADDSVRLFDVESGKQVLSLDPGDNRATFVAFSPDGSKLFTGAHGASGMIWDVRRSR